MKQFQFPETPASKSCILLWSVVLRSFYKLWIGVSQRNNEASVKAKETHCAWFIGHSVASGLLALLNNPLKVLNDRPSRCCNIFAVFPAAWTSRLLQPSVFPLIRALCARCNLLHVSVAACSTVFNHYCSIKQFSSSDKPNWYSGG